PPAGRAHRGGAVARRANLVLGPPRGGAGPAARTHGGLPGTDPPAQAAGGGPPPPAPPHIVLGRWTHAARPGRRVCPPPRPCLNAEADPRIGGTLRFDIEEAGSTFRVSGNYLTLQRPYRVAFTWSCSTWPDPTIQTIVTVTIEPDGAGASIMTIEHELLPPALVRQHAHGWTVISTQLETRLRSTPGRRCGARLSATG